MKEEQLKKLAAATLVGFILLGAIILALMIGSTIDGAAQAQAYDLNCLAEPLTEPLKECAK